MGILDTVTSTLASWKAKVRLDKPAAWKFEVEIDGFRDKGYMECTGLSKVINTETISECNSFQKTLIPVATGVKFVTLKKAISFDSKMEEWFYEFESYTRGSPDPRRDVIIRQLYAIPEAVPFLGGQTVELKSWLLPKAYLLQVKGPDFKALKGSGLSIQTIKLKSTDITEIADYGAIASFFTAVQYYTR